VALKVEGVVNRLNPGDSAMRSERVVVITGAAGGIGSALVERFLANGGTIVAADRDEKALASLCQTHQGRALTSVPMDVADEESCDRLAAHARASCGRVDVLVNCAGYFPAVPFEQMTSGQWQEVLAIKLTGSFLVTKALLPLMRGRWWGRIVNIGSASTFEGVPGQAQYVAAKAGIVGFSRSLARELGPHGITVNVVTPGLTLTAPILAAFPPEMFAAQRKLRAIGRDEQPGDLAGAVVFLASPDADFITGPTINVDGGKSMV
jgi:NAD(P)-dependent dehydrogenase (short-subunit alcohol dehydrogenase family)